MKSEQELKKVELKNCIKLEKEKIGKSIGRMLQEKRLKKLLMECYRMQMN